MTAREAAVAAEIRRVAREELGIERTFGDREELAAQLDSVALLSLVVAVEDRFRLKIADDDAATTRCLADLARLVVERAEPAALPPERAPEGAER
ncbi:MAG TPA: acyl carrier protein [Anaeromyxobacteraceae bacterium]|nr:acyl carrier protein [Anaeromyxobacteraceae bacterium]